MDDITKDAMGIVFPKFLKNDNIKRDVEQFFGEFDEGTLERFLKGVKGKVGLSEELVYQTESENKIYDLEYDCQSNILTMRIYYKELSDIIEKRMSTFVQVVKRTIVEEHECFPSFERKIGGEVSYGMQAGLKFEEFGKELGELTVNKHNGEEVSTLDVTNYLKQTTYSANVDDKYSVVRSRVYSGDATFYGLCYIDSGYVAQSIEEFDDFDKFLSGTPQRRVTEKNLFIVDADERVDLFDESIDLNSVNDGACEVFKHTELTFGKNAKEKYYIKGCETSAERENSTFFGDLQLREITAENYKNIQDDSEYFQRIAQTIQNNKEGRIL